MIRKKIPVVLLILFPVLLYGSSSRIIEINTRHFTVVYPSELSASAMDITCRAEAFISSYVNFMQYEPSARLRLRITAPADAGTDSGNFFPLDSGGTIVFEAVDYPGYDLYIAEVLFNRYMKFFSDNFDGLPGIDDNMRSGLMDYINNGIDNRSIMLLNDHVHNRLNGKLPACGDNYPGENLQDCMSVFFWEYLVTEYGKDTAAQSLKDAAYYDGFIKSLCRVTGKDAKSIFDGFRFFLGRYVTQVKPEEYEIIPGLSGLAYAVVVHCCSADCKSYAFIAENKDNYYLFSMKGGQTSSSLIGSFRGDIRPSSITILGEHIVISGYDRYGSVLLCYDGTGSKLLWEKKFPFIYISHIHGDRSGLRLLFSARIDGQSSLFIYDMKSVAVLKTEDDGIDIIDPSFTPTDKILYVRRDNIYSLVLFDAAAGTVDEVYRSSSSISGPVEDSSGRILFSETARGVTDIRSIDRSAGTADKITGGSTSNIYPLIMNGRLLFLNYYKGCYRPVSHPSFLK